MRASVLVLLMCAVLASMAAAVSLEAESQWRIPLAPFNKPDTFYAKAVVVEPIRDPHNPASVKGLPDFCRTYAASDAEGQSSKPLALGDGPDGGVESLFKFETCDCETCNAWYKEHFKIVKPETETGVLTEEERKEVKLQITIRTAPEKTPERKTSFEKPPPIPDSGTDVDGELSLLETSALDEPLRAQLFMESSIVSLTQVPGPDDENKPAAEKTLGNVVALGDRVSLDTAYPMKSGVPLYEVLKRYPNLAMETFYFRLEIKSVGLDEEGKPTVMGCYMFPFKLSTCEDKALFSQTSG